MLRWYITDKVCNKSKDLMTLQITGMSLTEFHHNKHVCIVKDLQKVSCFPVSRKQMCTDGIKQSYLITLKARSVNLHEKLTTFLHLLSLRHSSCSSEISWTVGGVRGDACHAAAGRAGLCGELWSSALLSSLSQRLISSENTNSGWAK